MQNLHNIPRGPGYQTCAACNLALLDHFENDGGSLARLFLAHEALGIRARLERVGIDA